MVRYSRIINATNIALTLALIMLLGGSAFCQTAPAAAYTPPPSVQIQPNADGTYKVTFKYQSAAQKVYIAGTFNDWATNKDEMQRYGNLFFITLDLPEGIHEYKFVEEGSEWVLDPLNMDRVDNGLGSKNNVLRLGKNIPAPTPIPPSLTQAAAAKSSGTLEWLASIP
ncbi:MAG: glycogen-binding domain-containing protein, partial [Candidatus Sumerlaeaceae bacterium]|nr:glycogen-binding domain-containing protein [Candidatus Sumerlaeaceae bacterium]